MQGQRRMWAALLVCAVLLAACGATSGTNSGRGETGAQASAAASVARPLTGGAASAAASQEQFTEASAAAEAAASMAGAPVAPADAQAGGAAPTTADALSERRPPEQEDPRHSEYPRSSEPPYDSTYYRNYGVNPFVDTRDDRLSTFAMDVDTASYSIMRRYIGDGYLPDPDSVRVEEYLNAFDYGYPRPDDDADFTIYTETAPSPFGGEGYELLQVGIKARDIAPAARMPTALTFVIDVSGSMEREGRLETVKQALALLVSQLRDDDSIAVVAYDDTARVVLEPTSGARKDTIIGAIDRLFPGGSTNVEAGLDLGFDLADEVLARGSNQVLLLSDGVANQGEVDPERLAAKYASSTDRGIKLSTIGVGMGNYNDIVLEQLADRGNGAYHYVDTLEEASRVFVEQLQGTLQLIARDAKIQVELNPDVVQRYRLVGYENRDVQDGQFRDDSTDAGEVGAGHNVTALYEIRRFPDAGGDLATVRIRYRLPDNSAVVEEQAVATAGAVRRSFESATPRFRMAASVAEFAELLRHERLARGSTLDELLDVAGAAAGELGDDGASREFVDLLYRAAAIAPREIRE